MFTKFFLILAITGGFIFTGSSILQRYNNISKIHTEANVTNIKIPPRAKLQSKLLAPKLKPASKTITLEDKNIVILRGPVTAKSVAEVQRKVLRLSHTLSQSDVIYLILNTPGGSVFSGLNLIDFLRAVPQKIHTITLFAASMGFQIVQNMDVRYITPNGTLMSHRAHLSGCKGQLDGEFESCYHMIKRKVDYLDAVASKRMDMTINQYKKLIVNEYWVHGFDATGENAADEMVNVKCGKSLTGTYIKKLQTIFGTAIVEFSKCPLIQAPINITFSRVVKGKLSQFRQYIDTAFTNNKKYVKEFILTKKHDTIFDL